MSVDKFKLRREKKKEKLRASHILKKGQRQKNGESKRTRVERGGRNQRSFTPSDLRLAGGKPRSPDATWRGVQGEWAVPDIIIGDAQGHACQNTSTFCLG